MALREPCGTTVPDTLTKMAGRASTEAQREFFLRQRDTFAREHVAQEQKIAPRDRTRTAALRLKLRPTQIGR